MIREHLETQESLGWMSEHQAFLEHAQEHDKQLCDPTIPILGDVMMECDKELKGTRKIIFSLMIDLGLLPTEYPILTKL